MTRSSGKPRIIRGPWPSRAPYPSEPIWTLLQDAAQRYPDTPAIVAETGAVTTRAQLWRAARAIAGYLGAHHGIGPGSVVAIASTGDADFAAGMFGALLLGAAVGPLNRALGSDDARHQLAELRPALLIAPTPLRAMVDRLHHEGALPCRIDVLPSEDLGRIAQERWPAAEPAAIDAHRDVAMIPFSSGTGGLPRGIALTHANVMAATAQGVATDCLDPSSRVLNLRLFWTRLLLTLAAGAACVGQSAHDPARTLWLLERQAITHLLIRPWALRELVDEQRHRTPALPALRDVETGAEALSAALAREAADLLGCPVRQAYHLIETCGSANRARPGEDAGESVGWTVPDTEERLVDPASLRDVEPGETGELLIRGPQVMAAYWNQPQVTAAAMLDGGWLRTGDLARQDERGRLVIVDRLKDMFKVRGRPVSPNEVEAALLEHPDVRAAAVVGMPAPEGGEMPAAYVVCRDDAEVTELELELLVSRRLAPHKRPRVYEFVASLPVNGSGKILRRSLGPRPAARGTPTVSRDMTADVTCSRPAPD